ncbi:unnamed protein product, partial [Closterium sp. Naga37s-1]
GWEAAGGGWGAAGGGWEAAGGGREAAGGGWEAAGGGWEAAGGGWEAAGGGWEAAGGGWEAAGGGWEAAGGGWEAAGGGWEAAGGGSCEPAAGGNTDGSRFLGDGYCIDCVVKAADGSTVVRVEGRSMPSKRAAKQWTAAAVLRALASKEWPASANVLL